MHDVVSGERRRDRYDDFSLIGELDGVADQVHQDLAQPRWITPHGARHLGCHLSEKLEMFFARAHGQQAGRRMHDLGNVEGNGLELEVIGLDLRVIENVVQNHEQRFGRRAHELECTALLGGQLGIENQLHEA